MRDGEWLGPYGSQGVDVVILEFSEKWVIRGSLNKFPDFFRMDTFIDSTHMKL